jgi:hypothetical protein
MRLPHTSIDIKSRTAIATMATTLVLLVVGYCVADYYLLQGWNYCGAEFTLFVRTNGTVRDLTVQVHFYNLTHPESEQADSRSFWAKVEPSMYGAQTVSILVYRINSSDPVVITFSEFTPVGDLSFDVQHQLFYVNSVDVPRNVTEVSLYAAIYVKNRLGMRTCVASDCFSGKPSANGIGWDDFPQYKRTILTAGRLLLITLCVAVLATVVSKSRKSVPIPWLTIGSTIVMVSIYVFIGTGMDFAIPNYWGGISPWLLGAASPVFHGFYEHLLGNLSAFVLSGFTLEYWLRGAKRRYGFFWYFFPFAVNSLVDLLFEVRWSVWPSVGASFWVIGQSIVLALYLRFNRERIASGRWLDLACVLVSGFCLLSSTYITLIPWMPFRVGETTIELARGHLTFAAIFILSVGGIYLLRKNISFLRSALLCLGLSKPVAEHDHARAVEE